MVISKAKLYKYIKKHKRIFFAVGGALVIATSAIVGSIVKGMLSFEDKQLIYSNFNQVTKQHFRFASEKVAAYTGGEGDFIIEYIKMKQSGSKKNPLLHGRVELVYGYNKEYDIALDMQSTKLKNRGLTPIPYTPDMSDYLVRTVDDKPDFKTLDDYSKAGVGVDNQFKKISSNERGTFYGNFAFKIYGIYGSTIFDDKGKIIARIVLLVDEKAYNTQLRHKGLDIVDELRENIEQSI